MDTINGGTLAFLLLPNNHFCTIDKVFIIDKSAASKQVPQRLLLKRSKNQELPALLAHDKNELDLAQDFVVFSPSTDIDADPVSSPNDPGSFRDLVYPESHAPQVQKSSDLVPTADLQARQRHIQLIRATKINPSDLQAWLDLASHQEHLVSPAVDASSMINSERKTLADLRIAELLLRLLSEASITLEAQKYKQKLQDTLQQHLTSFPIWTLYLNACQANPVEFRFEDVKAQHMILYLTLRYTFFLRDTGYVELSIATWQALCEYHLFRPEHLAHLGRDFILADFEKFWESERPRFGEEGARGWCIHDQDDGIDPELRSILPDAKLGKTDKAIQIWTGAIKMKASFSAAAQQEFVLLWRGLIWCDLETNNAETAVSHLASFGCGDASIDINLNPI
ncbi:unnamed protein product [Aureobasidium pullulans]|nr:unnamed protein product [Aureobasidium pullulans]